MSRIGHLWMQPTNHFAASNLLYMIEANHPSSLALASYLASARAIPAEFRDRLRRLLERRTLNPETRRLLERTLERMEKSGNQPG